MSNINVENEAKEKILREDFPDYENWSEEKKEKMKSYIHVKKKS